MPRRPGIPGRIGVAIGYDEKLSHLLQGGADAILIPSRFEPCGLTQLYGLAYGCVPVAARTGGLADTIIDANEAALINGAATGILFDEVNGESLSDALRRAVALFAQKNVWRQIQQQGMRADFSWKRVGARYAELYRKIAGDDGMSLPLGAHLVAGGVRFAVRARDAARPGALPVPWLQRGTLSKCGATATSLPQRWRASDQGNAITFAPMAIGIPRQAFSSMPPSCWLTPMRNCWMAVFATIPARPTRRRHRLAGAQGGCCAIFRAQAATAAAFQARRPDI